MWCYAILRPSEFVDFVMSGTVRTHLHAVFEWCVCLCVFVLCVTGLLFLQPVFEGEHSCTACVGTLVLSFTGQMNQSFHGLCHRHPPNSVNTNWNANNKSTVLKLRKGQLYNIYGIQFRHI